MGSNELKKLGMQMSKSFAEEVVDIISKSSAGENSNQRCTRRRTVGNAIAPSSLIRTQEEKELNEDPKKYMSRKSAGNNLRKRGRPPRKCTAATVGTTFRTRGRLKTEAVVNAPESKSTESESYDEEASSQSDETMSDGTTESLLSIPPVDIKNPKESVTTRQRTRNARESTEKMSIIEPNVSIIGKKCPREHTDMKENYTDMTSDETDSENDEEFRSKSDFNVVKQQKNEDLELLRENSNVFEPIHSESYLMNHEAYLLAGKRMKFRKETNAQQNVMNDARARSGRVRRKGASKIVQKPVPSSRQKPRGTKEPISSIQSLIEKYPMPSEEITCDPKHHNEMQNLLKFSKLRIYHWHYLMTQQNFNIMLYGYGSKLEVVKACKDLFKINHNIITVDGLFPKINVKMFLADFCRATRQKEPVGSNILALAEDLVNSSNKFFPHTCIFVTNFDNLGWKTPLFVELLSTLLQIKNVRLFATTDNINVCSGITDAQMINLNFIWQKCDTFIPYTEEIKTTEALSQKALGGLTGLRSLELIKRSLTKKARQVFVELATLQIQRMQTRSRVKRKDVTPADVEFSALAKRCRDAYCAHTDAMLKSLLQEFIDHSLVKYTGGGNTLVVAGMNIEEIEKAIGIIEDDDVDF